MQSIITELKYYSKAGSQLIEYLNNNKIDIKLFMGLAFEFQIGHLLTFIRSKDIIVYADDKLYTVIYVGSEKMLTYKDGITLSERSKLPDNIKPDIINTYYCAILDAIRFIETPF
jgi:hypothetical protein